eukprot:TRINITY_DN27685_c0_g1_i1.p1 TRINITY_DN27685_c0_g1~~TRINITY_DN27685_c0_g1_i1.p1  ORF type:complete len:351 (+),score=58.77 TRINITY_DN27685_c0_g1_i1:88-1140(+)
MLLEVLGHSRALVQGSLRERRKSPLEARDGSNFEIRETVEGGSFVEVTIGLMLQWLFMSCWVGGLLSPVFALWAVWRGYHRIVLIYLIIVAAGYSVPEQLCGSSIAKDFIVRYIGCPFKRVGKYFEWQPRRERPAIFLYHPHGIFSWGYVTAGGWNSFFYDHSPPVVGLIADGLLHAPIFRFLFVVLVGAVDSASKSTLLKKLRRRESVALIPGGFEEATITKPGTDRVFLRHRKGFIKYALQNGYALVPVYTFGENDTYANLQGAWRFRWWLNSKKLGGVLPLGRWWCPILPRSVELITVGGQPLQLPRFGRPTQSDVDEWHEKYVKHLQQHYSKYAPVFGTGEKLEVW